MADEQQLELLNHGVETWNQWRKANPKIAIDLSDASLAQADIYGANLAGANLTYTNFFGANLAFANLSNAILAGTDFSHADLSSASLTKALLMETIFAKTNLSKAIGLETCEHFAPSVIDLSTLQLSGALPVVFLRGCGLAEAFISYLPSFQSHPIPFHPALINSSLSNKPLVQRLHGA